MTIKKSQFVKVLICLLLTAAIFIVYWQVSTFDFVSFDDPIYVTDNLPVKHGLTLKGIKWAFTTVYASNWHPLTWISHMADVELFGIKPGMHHITNVVLHILNSILLFILMEKMTGAFWRSALVAALFALHPIHVESVAWISERKDVLSTFFWMITMLGYHWYVQRPSISRYLLVGCSYALGLMAKPMLVTLPFVLLLLDFWPLKRTELNLDVPQDDPQKKQQWQLTLNPSFVLRLVLEKGPLILMALAASGATFYAQTSGGAVSSLERLHFAVRIQNAIVSYVSYLLKMFWPLNLSAFYPYPEQFSLFSVTVCLLLLIILIIIVIVAARRAPYLAVGFLWYLGTLVPVIGIVQVGSQSMADRYTYIPIIGIFVMIIWSLSDLLKKLNCNNMIYGISTVVILGFLSGLSWIQVATWRSSESVFTHALAVTKDNYIAHNSLGVALFEKGDTEGAIKHYKESIGIRANYLNAHCNLGVAFAKRKQYDEALTQYRECLRIKPGYPDAYYNMGLVFSDLGKDDEAIRQYQEVLKNYPRHENAHNNLGFIIAQKGNLDAAIYHYKQALEINPENLRTRTNLIDTLLKKGTLDDALFQVKEVLKTDPLKPHLYLRLAEIYIAKHEPDNAAAAYREAFSVDPSFTQALYGLVVLHAKQGRFEDAITLLRKIAELRPLDPAVDFNLACLYSRMGNTDDAVIYLKNAFDKGFRDIKALRTDPDLTNLRGTKYFNEALRYKQKP